MKKITIGVLLLVSLFIGFQLFVTGPRQDIADLERSVQNLKSGVEAPSRTVVLQLPPRNKVVEAVEDSARETGLSVQEINFLDGRAEIVSESDPVVVAKFALLISRSDDLHAVAADGTILPQSVVTIEPRN